MDLMPMKALLPKLARVVVCSALYAILIWLVQTTAQAVKATRDNLPLDAVHKLNYSDTLSIIRVLQGALATLTAASVSGSLELVQWRLASRPRGLSYPGNLALSPATGSKGILAIICSGRVSNSDRLWALLKATLQIALWLSSLSLLLNTSTVTVYDTATVYNPSAGVGRFNGSYVQPFLDGLQQVDSDGQWQMLPYSYYAPAYDMVSNPTFSVLSNPVGRRNRGDECDSYLLTGGLVMATPGVPPGDAAYPLVRLAAIHATQLEFTRDPAAVQFLDADCVNIGGAGGVRIGIRMCVKAPAPNTSSLDAGLFVCLNGVQDGVCMSDPGPIPNITTSLSLYHRYATVVVAKSNMSIVTVSEVSAPESAQPSLLDDLPAFRAALTWLLNYTAADIPAPSSIAQNFWSGRTELTDPTAQPAMVQNFQSLLALPLWLFNANGIGNPPLPNQTTPDLPPDFFVNAAVVAPYNKLQFDNAMVVVFVVLHGLVLAFVWAVFFWAFYSPSRQPPLSSFVVFDTAFKSYIDVDVGRDEGLRAGDSDVLEITRHVRTYAKTSHVDNYQAEKIAAAVPAP